jgi:hypothetical protein
MLSFPHDFSGNPGITLTAGFSFAPQSVASQIRPLKYACEACYIVESDSDP